MEKAALRKKYMELRKSLSPEELERRSSLICQHIFSHFQLHDKVISLFLPIERAREINTYKILEKALSLDLTIGIPKTNISNYELKMIQYEGPEQLEVSAFGIPEPKHGKTIAAEKFDFVFVPLLAIDKKGNRVGYGKGIYDRFLAKCSPNCQLVGLSVFDELEQEIEGIIASDVPLDMLMTPSGLHRFDRG